MDAALMKRPSAFIPVGMSAIALAIVLGYAAMFGIARQADEVFEPHRFEFELGPEAAELV